MEAHDLIIRADDLTDPRSQALVRRHLAGMHEDSPPESVHAFDISGLRQPGVTFWTGSVGAEPVVMGALRELDRANGELKSMRVADAWLGRGLGRRMLEHLMREARHRGLRQVWLETGSTPAFAPAIALYESAGFIACGPFGSYTDDPFSRFMTRSL